MRLQVLPVAVLLAVSCASPVRPPVLSELDAVRARPTMAETRRLAPQGHQEAERLFERAESAWRDGQIASSQIVAERAMAAYQRAEVLARIARATEGLESAKKELAHLEQTEAELTSKQKVAAAELSDLDLRLGIERDLETIPPATASSPDREAARRRAARTTITQGQLLCTSALLVEPTEKTAQQLLSSLAELSERLESTASAVPIDQALKLRSQCLARLTELRRPARQANPVSEAGDRLFVELAEVKFAPSRDDRGIAVVLRQVFDRRGISSEAKTQLGQLGAVAKTHKAGLLVVLHDAKGDATAASQARLQQVTELLRGAGAQSIKGIAAGARLPEVGAAPGSGAREANERVEVVFVTRN